jgi:uncharacterized protein
MLLFIIVIILIILSIIGFLIIPHLQNIITFHPTKLDKDHDFKLDTNITEHNIPSAKNTINLLYYHNPESTNYIIYAHGNAGNIETNMNHVFTDFGPYANIILFDYAGYGKSSGHPTINTVCENMYDVWTFVTKELKIKPENIILYGCSLGGAIITHLVKQIYKKELPKAIIIQSSFTSMVDIARDILPNLMYNLTKFFIDNTFNTLKYLQKIKNQTQIKILVAHSSDDEIINFNHSSKMAQKLDCDNVVIFGSHNEFTLGPDFWHIFKTYL